MSWGLDSGKAVRCLAVVLAEAVAVGSSPQDPYLAPPNMGAGGWCHHPPPVSPQRWVDVRQLWPGPKTCRCGGSRAFRAAWVEDAVDGQNLTTGCKVTAELEGAVSRLCLRSPPQLSVASGQLYPGLWTNACQCLAPRAAGAGMEQAPRVSAPARETRDPSAANGDLLQGLRTGLGPFFGPFFSSLPKKTTSSSSPFPFPLQPCPTLCV